MRPLRLVSVLMWLVVLSARAEDAEELARIHTEAIGGRERLDQWRAMRATGTVTAGGGELEFELIAARPNRVHVRIRSGGRELVQATDGASAWQFDGTTAKALAPAEARAFKADAEFDDPLASAPERGYALDFAGEVTWQERTAFKVLVTRPGEEPSFLLVDPETYFVVARVTQQVDARGVTVTMETRYDDFRPVAGILLPFQIQVFADGRLLRETVLRQVLPILEPPPETFALPATAERG